MTIEEKMEHFRSISLESANSQSVESLSSYKQSLDDDLTAYKEAAALMAEESKRVRMNQQNALSKKALNSAQMQIKKELTQTQMTLKAKLFELVSDKIAKYRKTPEYVQYLTEQIKTVMSEYSDSKIVIYIDPADSALLDTLKPAANGNLQVSETEFLGGTRTIIPDKNILIDNSFKTRLADEQEQFTITL